MEGTRNYYVGEERLLNHNLDDCIDGTGILLDDETKINDNKRKIENELGKNIEDFRLNEGIYCFDEYETDEKIVPTDFKIEKNRINVINLKIDFFENNNEILLECFDKNLEEVINFKIQAEDIVGIRNFGDIAGHSAIIDFVEQFENEDLKNSLINKVIDSKLDGWYTKNKNYIHNLFFIDSCYFEILTKFDISKNISMINSNEKNKEKIYVPLENKVMKSDNQLNIEKKYILEFKNLEVNEILKSELTLKYKKELVFMGITKKIINNNFFEEAINYELYFRLNNKYKIIFEYKNLQNPQYLILKENRIGTGKNVFLWSSINSEFFIKSYWEEIFYEKFQDFEKDKISHVYISDDYSIEFVIDKDDIPYIKIIDLEENIEVSQNEIFRRQ